MDRLTKWALRLGFAAAAAGALLSRDACLGGSHPPPPSTAQPVQTAAPAPSAAPAPTSTFATPPQ